MRERQGHLVERPLPLLSALDPAQEQEAERLADLALAAGGGARPTAILDGRVVPVLGTISVRH